MHFNQHEMMLSSVRYDMSCLFSTSLHDAVRFTTIAILKNISLDHDDYRLSNSHQIVFLGKLDAVAVMGRVAWHLGIMDRKYISACSSSKSSYSEEDGSSALNIAIEFNRAWFNKL